MYLVCTINIIMCPLSESLEATLREIEGDATTAAATPSIATPHIATPPTEKRTTESPVTGEINPSSGQQDKPSEASSGAAASVAGEGGDEGDKEATKDKKKKKKKKAKEEEKPAKRPGKGVPVAMIKKLQAAREEEERLRQEEFLRQQKEEEEREAKRLEKVKCVANYSYFTVHNCSLCEKEKRTTIITLTSQEQSRNGTH